MTVLGYLIRAVLWAVGTLAWCAAIAFVVFAFTGYIHG